MTNVDVAATLLEEGKLSESQLETARREERTSGEYIGDVLVRLGYLKEREIYEALSEKLALPYVEINGNVPRDVLTLLPSEFVYRNQCIPVGRNDGVIQVATLDPTNLKLLDDIRMLTGCEVEPVIARRQAILEGIEKLYGNTVEQIIRQFSPAEEESVEIKGDEGDISDLQRMASEPTIINLVNLIIYQAIEDKASDIHIEPYDKDLVVKYRIDGVLHVMPPPPKHLQAAVTSRVKIMAQMNIAERFMPQDGHIRVSKTGHDIDLRVSTIPTIYGESVVMRILDKSSIMYEIEELGMDPNEFRQFDGMLRMSHGIVLVTGPTGSGKTTTLYAALKHIYTEEKKIITVEEPVEYELQGINQMNVNRKRGLDFATALRHIVRQDPDIILVGEIRDRETADIAIRSSLTGHLVFSTLHTNDAPGAITRLIDMGVDPYLIASSLEGVVAQRLVRRNCRYCSEPYAPENEAFVRRYFTEEQIQGFRKGRGCDHCLHTGFRGRSGIFEVLPISEELRELILSRPSSSKIREAVDIQTLRDDGLRHVANGWTTMEEVLRVTEEGF